MGIGRLIRLLIARAPAMAVAVCLLLPLAQPYADYQANGKYLAFQLETEDSESDRVEPTAAIALLTLPAAPCFVFGASCIRGASGSSIISPLAYSRPQVRAPPEACA